MENRMRNSTETLDRIARIEKQLDRRIAAAYRKEVWEELKKMKELCAYYEEEIRRLNTRLEWAQKNEGESEAACCRNTIEIYENTLEGYRKLSSMPLFKKWAYVRREARVSRCRLGACHHLWEIKKRILKDEYGIEWYTPQEERPCLRFD